VISFAFMQAMSVNLC